MIQPITNSDSELDDPGRDPRACGPPRNPLGGADQDSGRGSPRGERRGRPAPTDVPEPPDDDGA